MRDFFQGLRSSGDPVVDAQRFLAPRCPDTWKHVEAVARKAVELAERFGADREAAYIAGCCHDLAAVVPKALLVQVAEGWRVDLSAEDRAIPQVLHGPLASVVMRERLRVLDPEILGAVRYHTTLRARASPLAKIVFVADKIAFDPTTPRTSYLGAVEQGLAKSLNEAAYAYLHFVVAHQKELGWRLHSNLLEAYKELRGER